MERTNALVFPTLCLHAMISPDEVGQGHCVADALDEVSIKQGRKVSLGGDKKCGGGADSIESASDARNRNDTRRRIARAGRCGPSKGVEKVGRKVFRIYQMYAVFRLGVVHPAHLLVFFLTNRGLTFSRVGTPFASVFLGKKPCIKCVCHAAASDRNRREADLHLEGLTKLMECCELQASWFSLRV